MRGLAGLVDFEAAARHSSFKRAAVELHKTPAAVSQQVKQLEQDLGFALFLRHPRNVELTEKGRTLAVTVARAMTEIRSEVNALRQDGDETVLRLSATHSFAMKWLVHRLQQLSQLYPDMDLRLDSSDGLANLEDGSCDLAIRYAPVTSNEEGQIIYVERHVVVFSPKLCDISKPQLTDLLAYPLIFEGTPDLWHRLLRQMDLSANTINLTKSYSHAGPLVQAAVAGQGIALAPLAIAFQDLRQGRLQTLPIAALPSAYCYRTVTAPHTREKTHIKAVREWLSQQFYEMESTYQQLAARRGLF